LELTVKKIFTSINSRNGFRAILTATAAFNLLPLIGLLSYCLSRPGGPFAPLGSEGLQQLINTLLLLILVGTGVAVIGTAIGWLTASCNFPGSRWLTLAQLLPLATPAYLLAAIFTDLGSKYSHRIHGMAWTVLVMVITTTPYVVLLCRESFQQSGKLQLEAARSLGLAPWACFLRVSLPMAIPAVAGGTALAGMEVVNEFGAVELLGVPTLSTGLLQRWQGEGDPQGAAALALVALAVVALLVAAETWQRRRSRRWDLGGPGDHGELWTLYGWRASLAQAICALPPLLCTALPLLWFARSWDQWRSDELADLLGLSCRSLVLGMAAAIFASLMALILALAKRWKTPAWLQRITFLAGLGYAIPGAVLALALLLVFAPLGLPPLALLLYGYGNRFLAVAKGGLDASLQRLAPSIEEAASSLGQRWPGVLYRIHLPLLRSPLLLGGLLVFVDTIKELPLTFALRPFKFDTLAVRVYQYAGDERLGAAIVPALIIVVLGLSAAFTLVPQLRKETTAVNNLASS
jgi:iron(III) transport system permease protein